MPRILCIDYGTIRCGIAHSDNDQKMAFPLSTVNTSDIYNFLNQYLLNHQLHLILLGMPIDMKGKDTQMGLKVKKFIYTLKKKYADIKTESIDERLSSRQAETSIGMSGIGKKKKKRQRLNR